MTGLRTFLSNLVGSYAMARCRKIARRFLRGIVYQVGHGHDEYATCVCIDKKVHLVLTHGYVDIDRCDDSCVPRTVDIQPACERAVTRFLETGERDSLEYDREGDMISRPSRSSAR